MNWDAAVERVTAEGQVFSIVDGEIGGVAVKLFEHAPPSLRDIFDSARARDDDIFLVYEDERWTFTDVMTRVDEIAAALVGHYDIAPGDRVAIGMRNYPEWVMSFAAITSIGAVAVCLNAWWTTDELRYGLEDSGSQLLIADGERATLVTPLLDDLDVRVLAVRTAAATGNESGVERVDRLEDVLASGVPMPDVVISPDDDAMILYTSGTTGNPKGAVSTHRAVVSGLMAFGCRAQVNELLKEPGGERHPFRTSFILIVPLFHVTGLVPVMMSCFSGGYKLVVMYKWNPERALELIEREGVTTFVGVPTQSWDLLESPAFDDHDTSSLLSVGGGGAPAPPELVQRVEDSFTRGRPNIGYGMTETNAYGPGNTGDDYVRRPRSTGRTVPIMEVKVAHDDGIELPVGEIGEIWFKGPNLIRGYWNKPEETAGTIIDGWLRSGDLGRVDDEGFIYVEDRAKDMVIRAGENVYCAEIEAVVYEHPAIYEAAVFGLPHQRLGEEVAVAVLVKDGHSVAAVEIQDHVRSRLAGFKVPSHVEFFTEQLPRNAGGKILKRQIRDDIVEQRG